MTQGVPAVVELGTLGLDRGGHLPVKRALGRCAPGARIEVRGADPALPVHLRALARSWGAGYVEERGRWILEKGAADRMKGAEQAGGADPRAPGAIVERPAASWGLAARGATVESGGPAFRFPLDEKAAVWTEDAPRAYAQAAAAQWDPATAVDWTASFVLMDDLEDAVVQVMTYLIENETAALLVPARFLAQVHPHFREVLQVLAIQAADEARHIEVFTRRAVLRRAQPGTSSVGGQVSLKSLVDEPDFSLALFLLSVLGEGSFLSLLWFLQTFGPDPITRQVTKLAAVDEARHVAFGLAHVAGCLTADPGLRARLVAAVEGRHDTLRHTSGLNEDVYDALLLIGAAAGGGDPWRPDALAEGHARVQALVADMDTQRRLRLLRLGFPEEEAARLSGLHTRNFM